MKPGKVVRLPRSWRYSVYSHSPRRCRVSLNRPEEECSVVTQLPVQCSIVTEEPYGEYLDENVGDAAQLPYVHRRAL